MRQVERNPELEKLKAWMRERGLDPTETLLVGGALADWIPLSAVRAAKWAGGLLLLGHSPKRIEDAARLAAGEHDDVKYRHIVDACRVLARREAETEEQARNRLALPAMTGDPHANQLAASSVISDVLAGLIRGERAIAAEIELRRSMTAAQIAERRATLREGQKDAIPVMASTREKRGAA